MADLSIQKYHTHVIVWYGTTLKRFYVEDSPDSVGSIEFWTEAIEKLYPALPFPDFWKVIELEIWDMRSPDMLEAGKLKQETLRDYDPVTAGDQTAVGLDFYGPRLALGIFECTDRSREFTRNALDHEIGHVYAELCGFRTNPVDDATRIIREQFNRLRPHHAAWDSEQEDWAEVYRSIMGYPEHKGYFSDNVPYQPGWELRTLMKCAHVFVTGSKGKTITDFRINDSWIQWEETTTETITKPGYWQWWPFIWYTQPSTTTVKQTTGWAVTESWDKFKWDGSTWKKI